MANFELPPTRMIPLDHSEFGGGRGLIDPERRRQRRLEPHEEMLEIYATDPALPNSGGAVAAGGQSIGPENSPETATIER